jgi:hypothetical protein
MFWVSLRARRGWRLVAILAATLGVGLPAQLLLTQSAAAASGPCGPPVVNPVACENTLPGDPPSDWQVNGVGDSTIQGYATSMSVDVGGTITFKIKTPASSYHIDILRLGYYQGLGARKVASNLKPSATLPQTQPACLTNSTTGLIDCGNWGVSASWTVPSNAVSGIYIAHLVRDDTGGDSQIPFVVRNDASHSDMLVSTSDATWQAYNAYGGNSLYTCTVACPPGNPLAYKAAYAVSYNRPFDGSFSTDGGASYLFYAEYQMVRFLEENGYDVSYTSQADVDQNGPLLLNHKVFISSGHDEYWSAGQRANVTAARDAGVNLAFFSGNEIFWKTRWGASSDGSNTPYRTLTTYKETHFNAVVDPSDPPTWTGAWADPRFSPPADGGVPANALTGQEFVVNAGTSDIQVPYQYSKDRLWRNTAAANLSPGQTLTLAPGVGTLGYEWDVDADNGFRPPGTVDLSSTTVSGVQPFLDYGSTTGTGTETHHLTLYKAPSGALVFGAGTVQWAWGLDNTNAWGSSSTDPSGKPPDPNVQQATVNLFADMGAQPATLMSGLVAASPSTDTTPPTSTITSPAPNANVQDGASVTITGTATDAGGGVVGGVEVSTDGGATWHPATMTTAAAPSVTWSYTWIAHGSPSATIESRATDDSANIETPSDAQSVKVGCPCSIWGANVVPATPDSGDGNAIEVGMKFTTDTFGTINGVRFYKAAANTGTHVGSLWSSTGQLLAQATFSGETSSGWQQVNFSPAVPVTANTTYVVSYHAPVGHYASTEAYFYPQPSPTPDGSSTVNSPPLHALRNTGSTVNGVFIYGSSSTFPTTSFNAENYWVDPVFSPAPAPGPVASATATALNGSASVTWSAPASGGPVTSYIVTPFIGSTAQSSTTVSGSPAPTSATITGLTNGTTYTFTVTAVNPNGSGAASPASNAVTPLASISSVFNGGFESGLSGWTTGGTTLPSASSVKTHSGTGSALLGRVSGQEVNGDSSLSQTVAIPAGSSTLTFWYLPATADDLCSGLGCVYDWEEAQIRSTSGATLASIFKSNSNSQTWTQVTFNTTPYAGQTVVLWFNTHEDGAKPPEDSDMYLDDVSLTGSGGPTAPAAPTNVSATAGNASATVTWTAPANGGSPITSYTVTPFIGSTAQTPTTVSGSPPGTSTTISGLTNGTAYTFAVSATNTIGTGPASTPSAAVTPSAPTPAAPTGVSATAGNGSATVTWTAPANGGSPITSYTVTPFIGSTAQTPTTVSGSPPATNTTISGLTNGTAYTFTVSATNANGTGPASTPSTAVTPSAPAPPSAPTNVSATAGNASATVTWTAPANGGPITSYTVTPFIGSTAQTPTTVNGSPPATSTTVSGLTNGTAYTFTVSATNANGTGPASTPSPAVTPSAPVPPSAPTNATATAGNGSASVSWTAPANGGSPITSYTVIPFIGSSPQTPTTVNGSPPATSTTVSGLTNGTAYTFTVSATNAVGTGLPSAASNAVTPTAAPTPAFVQQISAHSSGVSSLTLKPNANVVSGNRLIVEVGVWSGGGATTSSVTDSAGDTYVELLHFQASDKTEMSVWSAPVTAGGGTRPTITVKPSAAADVGAAALEYTGLSTVADATVVDQMVHTSGTTNAAASVSSGATPATTTAGELALGFYADSGFGDTLTYGSGFTGRVNVSNTGDMELLAEDQPVALGAKPAAAAGTGAKTIWLMATIVFHHG